MVLWDPGAVPALDFGLDDVNAVRVKVRQGSEDVVLGRGGAGITVEVTDQDVVGLHGDDASEEAFQFLFLERAELDELDVVVSGMQSGQYDGAEKALVVVSLYEKEEPPVRHPPTPRRSWT